MGSSLYAAATSLAYGKKNLNKPHSPAVLPIDGRIAFIFVAILCIILTVMVHYWLEAPPVKGESIEIRESDNQKKEEKRIDLEALTDEEKG